MPFKIVIAVIFTAFSSIAQAGHVVYGFAGVIDSFYGGGEFSGTLTIQTNSIVRSNSDGTNLSFSAYSGCGEVRDRRCTWDNSHRLEVQAPIISKATLDTPFGSYLYIPAAYGPETSTIVEQQITGPGTTSVTYYLSQYQNVFSGQNLISSIAQAMLFSFPHNASPMLGLGDLTALPDIDGGVAEFMAYESRCSVIDNQCSSHAADYSMSGRLNRI